MANLNRKDVMELLLTEKRRKGITYDEIAKKLNRNKVWTTAAILGQHPMAENEAEIVLETLGFNENVTANYADIKGLLKEIPVRGNNPWPPADPTMYRFYEIVNVYGPSIKALVHEECGDGIVSGINCKLEVQKQVVDGDDWIEIKILGKFLRYPND